MEQPDFNELYTKFSAHEVQCEERWKTIFSRVERMDAKMDRLQNMLMGATGTVILFLGGIIITLLNT